ncbi:MAG: hypothetical protein R3Y13_02040 [bacterium]
MVNSDENYKEFLENKLESLRIERLTKANELIEYSNELKKVMLDNGQMKADSGMNYKAVLEAYTDFVNEKEKINNDGSEENIKKLNIIKNCINNINNDLYNYAQTLINPCEFEDVIRINIKYADSKLIAAERPVFNPMLYDMKKEFVFQCLSDLNGINPENVREENKMAYQEMISRFVSLQSTIIDLLTYRADLEYEERFMDSNKDKESPEEIIYFENYMATVKRTLEFLIINTMKQNNNCLATKLYDNDLEASDINKEALELEYAELRTYAKDHLQSFKGTSFLPAEYGDSYLSALDLVDTFILEPNSTFKKKKQK